MASEVYSGFARQMVLGRDPNPSRLRRLCTRKRRYRGEREAYLQAVALSWDRRGNFQEYHCNYCLGWHIGSVEGERGLIVLEASNA